MRRVSTLIAIVVVLLSPASARADAVQDWNGIMLSTVASQNPFAQARFAAITQLAVFEAANACTRRYTPYLGTITAPAGASAEAAAIAAAHAVLKSYFPANGPTLDAALTQSLSAIPDGQSKLDGLAVGEAVAAEVIFLRSNDGASPPHTYMPVTGAAGIWQPTPPAFSPGILLHWKDLTPFGIESSDQFRSAPPPPLTSLRYAIDYAEVKKVGDANSTRRPPDRTAVARYFAVVSAVHAWNQAVQQVGAARGLSLTGNARAFALLNMAISDGLVSSMETKYHYVYWRPVTAIQSGHLDQNRFTNPDPGWLPLVTTPAFPSYPSAHASASYAAATVAQALFGDRHHPITLSHPGVPDVTLQYTTFSGITHDIDDARVFGGIHFRFDQNAGAKQGRRIGAYVYTRHLRRLH